MTLTIEHIDGITIDGATAAGDLHISMGCAGNRWSPPESPSIFAGDLTTEDGDSITVAELDESALDLLMEQVIGMPCWGAGGAE